MKKFFIVLAAVLLFAGAFAICDEVTLIDFTLLDADILPDANGNPVQNKRTSMDYSIAAPISYTADQKALLKTSLALRNWKVALNSSAQSVESAGKSLVRPVPVKTSPIDYFTGKNVMGVRILFPTTAVNASAKIVPDFKIPAYESLADRDDNGVPLEPTDEQKASQKTQFEDGYGVIKNVGVIKEIAVRVRGNQFPYSLYILLEDHKGVERRYFMGHLDFQGWKTLSWKNPAYIANVRARNYTQSPLYPNTEKPFIKFIGFQITRDASVPGGDFISYFGDVRVIYDKAQIDTDQNGAPLESDIEEENVWGIITTEEEARQTAELARFGSRQILENAESQKVAQEVDFNTLDQQQ